VSARHAAGALTYRRQGVLSLGRGGCPRFKRRSTRAFSARIARFSRSVRQSGQIVAARPEGPLHVDTLANGPSKANDGPTTSPGESLGLVGLAGSQARIRLASLW